MDTVSTARGTKGSRVVFSFVSFFERALGERKAIVAVLLCGSSDLE